MLKLHGDAPEWLAIIPARGDSPALELLVKPITRAAVRQARAAVAALRDDGAASLMAASDAMTAALLRAGVVDWKGVGDAAGAPLPFSADALERFLDHPDAFEAAERAYVIPWVERDAEKNGSSGASNGISAAATPGQAIASKSAAPQKTAAVSKGRTARPAPTASTGLKPAKRKRSLQ